MCVFLADDHMYARNVRHTLPMVIVCHVAAACQQLLGDCCADEAVPSMIKIFMLIPRAMDRSARRAGENHEPRRPAPAPSPARRLVA